MITIDSCGSVHVHNTLKIHLGKHSFFYVFSDLGVLRLTIKHTKELTKELSILTSVASPPMFLYLSSSVEQVSKCINVKRQYIFRTRRHPLSNVMRSPFIGLSEHRPSRGNNNLLTVQLPSSCSI